MPSRDLIDDRRVQLPAIDPAELSATDVHLDGVFELDSVRVTGDDAGGVRGEGSIEDSVLAQVNLSDARLEPLRLVNSVLRGVDLSNTLLQQVLARRAHLTGCRATGLRMSVEHATDLLVEESKLDYATLHIERVKGVAAFVGCTFREATISGNLTDVVFLDCDFTEAEFRASGALRCDLRTSDLAGARGLLSLRGARISGEQAVTVSAVLASEAGLVVID